MYGKDMAVSVLVLSQAYLQRQGSLPSATQVKQYFDFVEGLFTEAEKREDAYQNKRQQASQEKSP